MSKGSNKKKSKSEISKSRDISNEENGVHEENQLTSEAEIIEIEEQLEDIDPNIFDGVNPQKKAELLRTIRSATLRVTERHHSGPLPPADLMIQYDSVIPNGAERIMVMAEKQQDHRMALEKKAVGHKLSESSRGQYFGFILAIICLIASVYLGATGHEWLAGVLGSTTIISLVGVFVLGKLTERGSKPSNPPEDDEE